MAKVKRGEIPVLYEKLVVRYAKEDAEKYAGRPRCPVCHGITFQGICGYCHDRREEIPGWKPSWANEVIEDPNIMALI